MVHTNFQRVIVTAISPSELKVGSSYVTANPNPVSAIHPPNSWPAAAPPLIGQSLIEPNTSLSGESPKGSPQGLCLTERLAPEAQIQTWIRNNLGFDKGCFTLDKLLKIRWTS
ncbi:hypothetical protein PSTT_17073 [Puccinia striiformis]|uniref:Uncharacterized protein n=1 Tax=Puccinia striiformis TaxID=27350 RepID=A0A2S4U9P5_9BASI|nr:hypothetical protein PSTT_17073 [Puccinia striiformis]